MFIALTSLSLLDIIAPWFLFHLGYHWKSNWGDLV